tara:strand:+ start:626 stop:871 length:246 start_codon:yes stop_codon:yes gene_type:complete
VLIFRYDYCAGLGAGLGAGDEYLGGVAGFDLVVAARYFVVVLVFAVDYDDGEVGVQEGEGAVLEGARGVALGVDVADFFDF